MHCVYSAEHKRRNSKTELSGGELVRPFECPERAEYVLARFREVGLGEVLAPEAFGLAPVLEIHDPDYLAFLESCWRDWTAAGYPGEAIAVVWPSRNMWRERPPQDLEGRLGYYALAAETSISEGTWEAALAAVDVALSGQSIVAGGERAAFALCRPPGHHAASDAFGGYCFLNNAAIAAQAFIDGGAGRVAVLDVDFHHGNGTQQIFYERADVLFASIHGDPDRAFPNFLGFADETGRGAGEGFNVNYPLPPGTTYGAWAEAMEGALAKIADYAPDALVVSLGVDTFKDDPISFFKLASDDYLRMGEAIAGAGLATLFVMEGGYAVREIGINAVNVLQGFENG